MSSGPLSILVVSGTYPPDIGGAELSLRTRCRELARRGHRVVVLADDRRPERAAVDGVPVYGTAPQDVPRALDQLHKEARFDVLLTQLIYSREALRFASSERLPSVYFVRNACMRVELSHGAQDAPTRIAASSRFLAARSAERWGRPCDVIYPCIDPQAVIPAARDGEAVGLVNPILLKGGDVLRELALRCPARRFLAVRCWSGLRRRGADGDWDARQWALMAEAHDDPTVHPPEEPALSDLANVTVLPPAADMRAFYGRIRVLLAPARWEEAFGRSILEALLCGIPVLATNVGGIAETGLRWGGALLDADADCDVFGRALEALDEPGHYTQASEGARRDAAWYSHDEQVERLERVLRAAVRGEEGRA